MNSSVESYFPLQASIPDQDAVAALLEQEYKIAAPVQCRLFDHGNHDVYQVKTGAGSFFFKIYHPGFGGDQGAQATLIAILEVVHGLAAHGMGVAQLIPTKAGEQFVEITAPEGKRLCVLWQHALGSKSSLPSTSESERAGAALARFHNVSSQMKAPENLPQLLTPDLFAASIKKFEPYIGEHSDELEFIGELADSITEEIEQVKPQVGICHGDFHLRNVRFRGDDLVFFDFDCLATGYLCYDLACLHWSRLSMEGESFEKAEEIYEEVVRGYRSVRELSEAEYELSYSLVAAREIWAAGYQSEMVKHQGILGVSEEVFDGRLALLHEWSDEHGLLEEE